MFRVFICLTGEHDLRLVLLAGMVCLVASIVAINIFHRAIASQTGMRFVWIAIAGAAIGYGIWATHFIAMLAYEPGISTGYGIVLTASSLAAAMLLTSGGFGFAAIYPCRCRAPIGGGIIWRRHRLHALSRHVGARSAGPRQRRKVAFRHIRRCFTVAKERQKPIDPSCAIDSSASPLA
jgi:hypothetical protein